MRYFRLTSDESITDKPSPADFHDKLDIRNLTPEKASALPDRAFVRLEPNINTVFPEILCSPVLHVAEEARDVMKSYDEYISYKQIVYNDPVNELLQTYYMPILARIDCLERYADETGMRPADAEITLRRTPIRDKSIFQVHGAKRTLTIIRLDLAESFLARDFRGFQLTEVTVIH